MNLIRGRLLPIFSLRLHSLVQLPFQLLHALYLFCLLFWNSVVQEVIEWMEAVFLSEWKPSLH